MQGGPSGTLHESPGPAAAGKHTPGLRAASSQRRCSGRSALSGVALAGFKNTDFRCVTGLQGFALWVAPALPSDSPRWPCLWEQPYGCDSRPVRFAHFQRTVCRLFVRAGCTARPPSLQSTRLPPGQPCPPQPSPPVCPGSPSPGHQAVYRPSALSPTLGPLGKPRHMAPCTQGHSSGSGG